MGELLLAKSSPPNGLSAAADNTTMFQLVYTSTARSPMTKAELENILQVSRAANSVNGITGVLLFHRNSFLQVLEAEEDVVEAMFADIKRDLRHYNVIVRSRCLVGEREFDAWSMKFLDTSDWQIRPGLIGYNSLPDFAQAEMTLKPYLRRFHAGLWLQGALC